MMKPTIKVITQRKKSSESKNNTNKTSKSKKTNSKSKNNDNAIRTSVNSLRNSISSVNGSISINDSNPNYNNKNDLYYSSSSPKNRNTIIKNNNKSKLKLSTTTTLLNKKTNKMTTTRAISSLSHQQISSKDEKTYERLLYDGLVSLKKLIMMHYANEMSHDLKAVEYHVNDRARDSINESLENIKNNLFALQGPNPTHEQTAYSKLYDILIEDTSAIVFNQDRADIDTMKLEFLQKTEENNRVQHMLAQELAAKEQNIAVLISDRAELEAQLRAYQRSHESLKTELGKILQEQTHTHQHAVELRMQGLDYKAEVDRRCEKVIKSIQSRMGFVPAGVMKNIQHLRSLKAPGDPAYDVVRKFAYAKGLGFPEQIMVPSPTKTTQNSSSGNGKVATRSSSSSSSGNSRSRSRSRSRSGSPTRMRNQNQSSIIDYQSDSGSGFDNGGSGSGSSIGKVNKSQSLIDMEGEEDDEMVDSNGNATSVTTTTTTTTNNNNNYNNSSSNIKYNNNISDWATMIYNAEGIEAFMNNPNNRAKNDVRTRRSGSSSEGDGTLNSHEKAERNHSINSFNDDSDNSEEDDDDDDDDDDNNNEVDSLIWSKWDDQLSDYNNNSNDSRNSSAQSSPDRSRR